MSVIKNLCETVTGLKSLLVGLAVTGKNFASPQLTVHYPRQEVTNLSTYRGHIEFVASEEDPFMPRCVACCVCAKACPSGCLSIEGKDQPAACGPDLNVPAGAKEASRVATAATAAAGAQGAPAPAEDKAKPAKVKKTVGKAWLDYSKCSLCGQCVRACPAGALRFTQHVYYAGASRDDMYIELVQRFQQQALQNHPDKDGNKQ